MGGNALILVVGAGGALCLVVGILLSIFGMRGRRLDAHPVCRKCGFDLEGVFPGREVCPECGAGFEQRKAIRVGNRRRRRGAVGIGAVLLVGGLAGVGYVGYVGARTVQWIRLKPFWMLRLDADGTDVAASNSLAELARRIVAGRIGEEGARNLGETMLGRQADGSWLPECASVFEAAYGAGAMTDEEFGMYAARATDVQIVTRKAARAGLPLESWIYVGRTAAGLGSTMRIQYLDVRVLANGDEVLHRGRIGGTAFMGTSGGGSFGVEIPPISAEPGSCEVVAELRLGFHPDVELHEEYVASTVVTCRATVELVGPSVQLVTVVDDPASFELMSGKTRLKIFEVSRLRDVVSARLQFWLPEGAPSIAYDVFLRADDREWAADGFMAPAGLRGIGRYADLPADFDANVVDVIFRPSIKRAEQSSGIVEILGGEFVIENVPVEWREP